MNNLSLIANSIRQDTIKSLAKAGNGNTADSLGIVDILTALYFSALKHNPRAPEWDKRDRVFVNPIIRPAISATLAHAGYFAKKEASKWKIPGVELGGLSIAIGAAFASRLDNKKCKTYCILSDEDHSQGQTWEAALFAAKHKLSNLTVIVDRNHIQPEGYTEDIMPLESIRAKYEAFNWNVIEVDGHNIKHIVDALKESQQANKPTAIIAHTIPGKGISFMENQHEWAKPPTEEQAEIALAELEHNRK